MKKVKFTLGLMLSMLLLGANVINAELKPEDPSKKYVWSTQTLRSDLSVLASTHYYNDASINDFGVGPDDNEAIKYSEIYTQKDENGKVVTLDPPSDLDQILQAYDVRTTPFSSTNFSSGLIDDDYNGTTYSLDSCIAKRISYTQKFAITLSFTNGNEVIPFLKRKITTAKWMYDTVRDSNVWCGNLVIEELMLPYNITNKTQFTDGTGEATYEFTSDILSLLGKYSIYSIEYELWTNEHIGDQPGNGNAYPVVNHAVKINTEDGISIAPMKDIHYVTAYQDYTFEVHGQEGEELEIVTNNPHYAINKGIKIVATSGRTWNVTISKVYVNMELSIGYKSTTTESGEGGEDGETGNATVEKDAIWAAGGTLYVKTGTPGTLSIYTITGQLYKQDAISGSYTLSMPKGIYIVQLNGKAYKVVL